MELCSLQAVLEKFAPLSLSKRLIEQGDFDNSGLLIKTHGSVSGVLCALDLSENAVREAKRVKADTIITHHPVIYYPVSEINEDEPKGKAVILAVKNGINVIAMHLNLDVAENGIDYYLCKGLKGENAVILDHMSKTEGYGREFNIEPTTLSEYEK